MPDLSNLPNDLTITVEPDYIDRKHEFFNLTNDQGLIVPDKLKGYVNKYYPGSNAAESPERYTQSSDPYIRNFATTLTGSQVGSIKTDSLFGETNYYDSKPHTSVYGMAPEPLRTLVHEVGHTELRSNPRASMDTGLDLPYSGLEKARERYQALTYGADPESNQDWQMRAMESDYKHLKYEDMLSELKGYEATLPAGTNILNTSLGNHLFPTKDEKLAYLIHSQPMYTQKGYEPSKMPLAPTGNWQKDMVNKASQTVDDATNFIKNTIRGK
jgi:hypothetical protein